MGTALAQSVRRFEMPDAASIVEGNGGLQKICINSSAVAGEIYLHGAQVTSWKPAGMDEVLFLSSQSRWESGHAIRGGIPICFPWFGGKADDPKAPAHGFVRTKAWRLKSIAQVGDGIAVSLFTESDATTKQWWPAEFHLAYQVIFDSDLLLKLTVTNTGKKSLSFEEALHAYHRVGSILNTRVGGLHAVSYLDKTDLNRKKFQRGEIAIVSETDRVYLNTSDAIELEDPVFRRRTQVAKGNSCTTVVWNPWVQKAYSLSDLGDDEWIQMICIETSNVADFAINLAPGEHHKMRAIIRVARF